MHRYMIEVAAVTWATLEYSHAHSHISESYALLCLVALNIKEKQMKGSF